MNHRRRARIIGLSVLCMAAGSFVAKPAFAAPSTSGTPSAPVASCNGDKNVDIFNFNDFHGRIATGASLVHEPVRVRGEPLPAGFSAPSVAQADATSLSRCGQQAEFLSGREPP